MSVKWDVIISNIFVDSKNELQRKNFVVTIITTKLLAKFKEWNSEKKSAWDLGQC